MKTITGDLLNQKGLLVHQVNCQGAFGAGLALQIAQRWPRVRKEYGDLVRWNNVINQLEPYHLLGKIHLVDLVTPIICNLFGQLNYGSGKCFTDYQAHEVAWPRISNFAERHEMFIFVPYQIGCGLAGGSWETVGNIIADHCPEAIIVQLPEFRDPIPSLPIEAMPQ